MARITISDLHITQEKLLINEISNLESVSIFGGDSNNFQELVRFGIKSMEFILLAYAIDSISYLGSSFNNKD
ncbi:MULTISPECIES: hypothetical protein [unclassified Anabaena]|uniref:hypothetical protein n=1 Tax=unclassified Anabaena TaxID=2619674 RepID=UPI0014460E15|nr:MULTISPECIES: hypothetical protein [unclassified Anabaena]MTJ08927.1 hypothetical protein [Anabaena sp. UHCC 0204]MTJ51281.1 hypothetical protein [Anabaena sp. UHCC 0253]